MSPTVERLLAHEEIRQLAARYAVATDAARSRHARVAVRRRRARRPRRAGPRRAEGVLHAVAARRRRHDPQRRHAPHRPRRRRSDTHAASCTAAAEIQDGDRWIVQAIQYRDDVRASRRALVLRPPQAPALVRARRRHEPARPPPANWPEHHDGWGELPEASPTWAEFWGDDAPQHYRAADPLRRRRRAERVDVVGRPAELGEDLVGVLADLGRHPRAPPSACRRSRTGVLIMVAALEPSGTSRKRVAGPGLRVGEHLFGRLHRRPPHVFAVERLGPLVARARREHARRTAGDHLAHVARGGRRRRGSAGRRSTRGGRRRGTGWASGGRLRGR